MNYAYNLSKQIARANKFFARKNGYDVKAYNHGKLQAIVYKDSILIDGIHSHEEAWKKACDLICIKDVDACRLRPTELDTFRFLLDFRKAQNFNECEALECRVKELAHYHNLLYTEVDCTDVSVGLMDDWMVKVEGEDFYSVARMLINAKEIGMQVVVQQN